MRRADLEPAVREGILSAEQADRLAAFIRTENEKWGKVIREAKIKPE